MGRKNCIDDGIHVKTSDSVFQNYDISYHALGFIICRLFD